MQGRRLFPVALYGTLLGALCCLLAPQSARSVQELLQAVQGWPLCRLARLLGGGGGAAAAPEGRLSELLTRALERAAADPGGASMPEGLEPVPCRVVAVLGSGGAGLPAELVLDRSAEDVADCAAFATYGEQLLGFLAAGSDGAARVELLHAPTRGERLARRVPAVLETERGALRLIVEPASSVERWPLQGMLLDDPYAASRLRHSGATVRSEALAGDPLGLLPGGLRLGSLCVLGYPEVADGPPIGLFVQPDLDPRAIPVAVLWRARSAEGTARAGLTPPRGAWHAAHCLCLPAPAGGERWLVGVDGVAVPDGAAVAAGGQLLGIVDQALGDHGYLSPFGGTRRLWSLLVLPRGKDQPPEPVLCRVLGSEPGARGDAQRVRLAVQGAPLRSFGPVLTGPNGWHCPSGILVGWAEPAALGQEILVQRRVSRWARPALFVGAGKGP